MNKCISNPGQIASIRHYIMADGRERGLEVLDCDNGKLRFLLNVTKGLDVMQLYHEGMNVSFISKNGFTARETPFLKRFEGGMLYTVGLDCAGGRPGFDLHGTYHNLPAKLLKVTCDERGIEVIAEISDSELFGKNLLLRRTVTSALGSETVELHDEIRNIGYRDEEFCTLYHINVGYPMLAPGARIGMNVASVEARTPRAKEKQNEMFDITEPLDGQEETCYFLKLNEPEVRVTNENLGKEFVMRYEGKTLTEFIEWKSMASGDYALGLEPTTTKLDDAFAFTPIRAGETVENRIFFTVRKLK